MSRDSLSENAATDRYAESASSLGGLPGDLLVVVTYAVVAGGLVVMGLPSALQFIVGIPLAVFVPGYTVLSVLFPGRPSRNAGQVSSLSGMSRSFSSLRSIQQRGVRWGERVALSFGLSLFVIPLLALVLDFSTLVFGTGSLYRTGPIVATLVGFSVLCAFVGLVRRLRLPRAERFGVPVGYWVDDFIGGLTGSPADALLNVVLILSVLVGAASMTYALAVPQDGSSSTNFYVGTQNGSGEVTVGDYPRNMTADQPQQLTVGVQNHEGEPANYSVVVQLQRYSGEEVLARNTLNRFSTGTVPENRTWRRQHTVTPTIAEDDLQLVYLLYQGDPPQNPTEENAYHSIHLSVNVSGGGGSAGGGGGAGGAGGSTNGSV